MRIQLKVFHGHPAWNKGNVRKNSELQNTVLHTATGGYSKAVVWSLKVITGVRQVYIQNQIRTIKFLS